jgi:RimJ/RimL family protein N-acetyltransferase
VLAGIHPGRILVDDASQPRTALVTRDDGWCFLAGDPGNDGFNRAVNRAIRDREIVSPKASTLLFTCHPEEWEGKLGDVFAPRQPIAARRRRYACGEMRYDGRSELPAGLTIQPMDESLLKRPDLRVPDEVVQTIRRWRSIADPGIADFGFVAIQETARGTSEVASWATIDAVVEGVGDAGLFTEARHRRRGLATLTAAAALEHGLAHGLSEVNWTCAEDNAGSIRTAEKLGFERLPDYMMYYFVFDEAQHLAHLAYQLLESGRAREAIDALEQSLALTDDPPYWLYHDAARAWAALAEPAEALKALNQAVDRGWCDADGTRACQEFKPLHRLPEWEAVLERMTQRG